MSDLIAFLSARLDERAKASQGAGVVAWLTYRDAQGGMNYTTVAALALETADGDLIKAPWCAGGELLPEPSSVTVIYNEREVQADIAAKRHILKHHGDTHDCGDPRSWESPYVGCCDLRILAAIYSDHPDYPPRVEA